MPLKAAPWRLIAAVLALTSLFVAGPMQVSAATLTASQTVTLTASETLTASRSAQTVSISVSMSRTVTLSGSHGSPSRTASPSNEKTASESGTVSGGEPSPSPAANSTDSIALSESNTPSGDSQTHTRSVTEDETATESESESAATFSRSPSTESTATRSFSIDRDASETTTGTVSSTQSESESFTTSTSLTDTSNRSISVEQTLTDSESLSRSPSESEPVTSTKEPTTSDTRSESSSETRSLSGPTDSRSVSWSRSSTPSYPPTRSMTLTLSLSLQSTRSTTSSQSATATLSPNTASGSVSPHTPSKTATLSWSYSAATSTMSKTKGTVSASVSGTASPTVSRTGSATTSLPITGSCSTSLTPSAATPSATVSMTVTRHTASDSQSRRTVSRTLSKSDSLVPTPSRTVSFTRTGTVTFSGGSRSQTASWTFSRSLSFSLSRSVRTASATATTSSTISATVTPAPTRSPSSSFTMSVSASGSAATPSQTSSGTITVSGATESLTIPPTRSATTSATASWSGASPTKSGSHSHSFYSFTVSLSWPTQSRSRSKGTFSKPITGSGSLSLSPTPTVSANSRSHTITTRTFELTPSRTLPPTMTPTLSLSHTVSANTMSPSRSSTVTTSATESTSSSTSESTSESVSPSESASESFTVSTSATESLSTSATVSESETVSASRSASSSESASASDSASPSVSVSLEPTETDTMTLSESPSPSTTTSPSESGPSSSPSPSNEATASSSETLPTPSGGRASLSGSASETTSPSVSESLSSTGTVSDEPTLAFSPDRAVALMIVVDAPIWESHRVTAGHSQSAALLPIDAGNAWLKANAPRIAATVVSLRPGVDPATAASFSVSATATQVDETSRGDAIILCTAGVPSGVAAVAFISVVEPLLRASLPPPLVAFGIVAARPFGEAFLPPSATVDASTNASLLPGYSHRDAIGAASSMNSVEAVGPVHGLLACGTTATVAAVEDAQSFGWWSVHVFDRRGDRVPSVDGLVAVTYFASTVSEGTGRTRRSLRVAVVADASVAVASGQVHVEASGSDGSTLRRLNGSDAEYRVILQWSVRRFYLAATRSVALWRLPTTTATGQLRRVSAVFGAGNVVAFATVDTASLFALNNFTATGDALFRAGFGITMEMISADFMFTSGAQVLSLRAAPGLSFFVAANRAANSTNVTSFQSGWPTPTVVADRADVAGFLKLTLTHSICQAVTTTIEVVSTEADPSPSTGGAADLALCFGESRELCSSHGACEQPSATRPQYRCSCFSSTSYGFWRTVDPALPCTSCAEGYTLASGCRQRAACTPATCLNGDCVGAPGECQCYNNATAGHFTGLNCAQCQPGFSRESNCQNCSAWFHGPRCSILCIDDDTCHGHGTCNANGRCSCAQSVVSGFWTGEACDRCAAGYRSVPGAPCSARCEATTTCSGHGSCDAVTTAAVDSTAPACTCFSDSGRGFWMTSNGAQQECSVCEPDYSEASGCRTPVMVLGQGCDATCDPAGGVCQLMPATEAQACVCNRGFTGRDCDRCANSAVEGRWDPATRCSTCLAGFYGISCTLPCPLNNCSGHGRCDRVTGACVCSRSLTGGAWSGERCERCASGYYPSPDAVFEVVNRGFPQLRVPPCTIRCAPNSASCVHGTCSDNSWVESAVAEATLQAGRKATVCSCIAGWAGVTCDTCDNAPGMNWRAVQASRSTFAVNAVPGRTTCSACIRGYAGAACNVSLCTASTCSGHGSCTDAPSGPMCACVVNNVVGFWSGERCLDCLPPFGGPSCLNTHDDAVRQNTIAAAQGSTSAADAATQLASCMRQPVVLRLGFSASHSELFVVFEAAVNPDATVRIAGTREVSCGGLFDPALTSRLGTGATCVMEAPTAVRVLLGIDHSVQALEVVNVRARSFQSVACPGVFSPDTNITVAPPLALAYAAGSTSRRQTAAAGTTVLLPPPSAVPQLGLAVSSVDFSVDAVTGLVEPASSLRFDVAAPSSSSQGSLRRLVSFRVLDVDPLIEASQAGDAEAAVAVERARRASVVSAVQVHLQRLLDAQSGEGVTQAVLQVGSAALSAGYTYRFNARACEITQGTCATSPVRAVTVRSGSDSADTSRRLQSSEAQRLCGAQFAVALLSAPHQVFASDGLTVSATAPIPPTRSVGGQLVNVSYAWSIRGLDASLGSNAWPIRTNDATLTIPAGEWPRMLTAPLNRSRVTIATEVIARCNLGAVTLASSSASHEVTILPTQLDARIFAPAVMRVHHQVPLVIQGICVDRLSALTPEEVNPAAAMASWRCTTRQATACAGALGAAINASAGSLTLDLRGATPAPNVGASDEYSLRLVCTDGLRQSTAAVELVLINSPAATAGAKVGAVITVAGLTSAPLTNGLRDGDASRVATEEESLFDISAGVEFPLLDEQPETLAARNTRQAQAGSASWKWSVHPSLSAFLSLADPDVAPLGTTSKTLRLRASELDGLRQVLLAVNATFAAEGTSTSCDVVLDVPPTPVGGRVSVEGVAGCTSDECLGTVSATNWIVPAASTDEAPSTYFTSSVSAPALQRCSVEFRYELAFEDGSTVPLTLGWITSARVPVSLSCATLGDACNGAEVPLATVVVQVRTACRTERLVLFSSIRTASTGFPLVARSARQTADVGGELRTAVAMAHAASTASSPLAMLKAVDEAGAQLNQALQQQSLLDALNAGPEPCEALIALSTSSALAAVTMATMNEQQTATQERAVAAERPLIALDDSAAGTARAALRTSRAIAALSARTADALPLWCHAATSAATVPAGNHTSMAMYEIEAALRASAVSECSAFSGIPNLLARSVLSVGRAPRASRYLLSATAASSAMGHSRLFASETTWGTMLTSALDATLACSRATSPTVAGRYVNASSRRQQLSVSTASTQQGMGSLLRAAEVSAHLAWNNAVGSAGFSQQLSADVQLTCVRATGVTATTPYVSLGSARVAVTASNELLTAVAGTGVPSSLLCGLTLHSNSGGVSGTTSLLRNMLRVYAAASATATSALSTMTLSGDAAAIVATSVSDIGFTTSSLLDLARPQTTAGSACTDFAFATATAANATNDLVSRCAFQAESGGAVFLDSLRHCYLVQGANVATPRCRCCLGAPSLEAAHAESSPPSLGAGLVALATAPVESWIAIDSVMPWAALSQAATQSPAARAPDSGPSVSECASSAVGAHVGLVVATCVAPVVAVLLFGIASHVDRGAGRAASGRAVSAAARRFVGGRQSGGSVSHPPLRDTDAHVGFPSRWLRGHPLLGAIVPRPSDAALPPLRYRALNFASHCTFLIAVAATVVFVAGWAGLPVTSPDDSWQPMWPEFVVASLAAFVLTGVGASQWTQRALRLDSARIAAATCRLTATTNAAAARELEGGMAVTKGGTMIDRSLHRFRAGELRDATGYLISEVLPAIASTSSDSEHSKDVAEAQGQSADIVADRVQQTAMRLANRYGCTRAEAATAVAGLLEGTAAALAAAEITAAPSPHDVFDPKEWGPLLLGVLAHDDEYPVHAVSAAAAAVAATGVPPSVAAVRDSLRLRVDTEVRGDDAASRVKQAIELVTGVEEGTGAEPHRVGPAASPLWFLARVFQTAGRRREAAALFSAAVCGSMPELFSLLLSVDENDTWWSAVGVIDAFDVPVPEKGSARPRRDVASQPRRRFRLMPDSDSDGDAVLRLDDIWVRDDDASDSDAHSAADAQGLAETPLGLNRSRPRTPLSQQRRDPEQEVEEERFPTPGLFWLDALARCPAPRRGSQPRAKTNQSTTSSAAPWVNQLCAEVRGDAAANSLGELVGLLLGAAGAIRLDDRVDATDLVVTYCRDAAGRHSVANVALLIDIASQEEDDASKIRFEALRAALTVCCRSVHGRFSPQDDPDEDFGHVWDRHARTFVAAGTAEDKARDVAPYDVEGVVAFLDLCDAGNVDGLRALAKLRDRDLLARHPQSTAAAHAMPTAAADRFACSPVASALRRIEKSGGAVKSLDVWHVAASSAARGSLAPSLALCTPAACATGIGSSVRPFSFASHALPLAGQAIERPAAVICEEGNHHGPFAIEGLSNCLIVAAMGGAVFTADADGLGVMAPERDGMGEWRRSSDPAPALTLINCNAVAIVGAAFSLCAPERSVNADVLRRNPVETSIAAVRMVRCDAACLLVGCTAELRSESASGEAATVVAATADPIVSFRSCASTPLCIRGDLSELPPVTVPQAIARRRIPGWMSFRFIARRSASASTAWITEGAVAGAMGTRVAARGSALSSSAAVLIIHVLMLLAVCVCVTVLSAIGHCDTSAAGDSVAYANASWMRSGAMLLISVAVVAWGLVSSLLTAVML